MKTQIKLAAALLLSSFILHPSSLLAQGSLTPPGAPAPTMKTLAQIEPRIPISDSITLSQPGSYYLTTNITVSRGDGITIASSGVTLDLNGFTIASTAVPAVGYGIKLNSGLRDLTIFNGHIRGGVTNNGSGSYSGSGFASGIYYSGTAPANTRVSGISVSGCLSHGIYLGTDDSTVVESCTVRTVGNYGIMASTIKSSVAVDCGGTAIFGDQVADSRGESSGSGDGISARATAQNCYGSGIQAGVDAYIAQNCFGYCSSGTGLHASYNALNCYGETRGNGAGLYAEFTAQNCYGLNNGGGNFGLVASTAQNCWGYTGSAAIGLQADVAFNCYGVSSSGTGLRFNKIGAMCRGERESGMLSDYVLGTGMAGPRNLP